MAIQHELFLFKRLAFCQLMVRIGSTRDLQSLEEGLKTTAKVFRNENQILEVLDQCGGWDSRSLDTDIESDSQLAILVLVLACYEERETIVPDGFRAGCFRSMGRTLADACGDQLGETEVQLLRNWRPPATSSAAYILDSSDLSTDDPEIADVRSRLIMRDCDLLHIVHG